MITTCTSTGMTAEAGFLASRMLIFPVARSISARASSFLFSAMHWIAPSVCWIELIASWSSVFSASFCSCCRCVSISGRSCCSASCCRFWKLEGGDDDPLAGSARSVVAFVLLERQPVTASTHDRMKITNSTFETDLPDLVSLLIVFSCQRVPGSSSHTVESQLLSATCQRASLKAGCWSGRFNRLVKNSTAYGLVCTGFSPYIPAKQLAFMANQKQASSFRFSEIVLFHYPFRPRLVSFRPKRPSRPALSGSAAFQFPALGPA